MTQAAHWRLAQWIAARQGKSGAQVIGINGAQGSGKSTLAQALRHELDRHFGLRAVILSLDDLYLTTAERQRLATEVHPLLATRGVPGTHDLALGRQLLNGMKNLGPGEGMALPRFIKATDDRAAEHDWPQVTGAVQVILFEGWCVGTPPQAEAELAQPINALEAEEDRDGRWRRHVNAQLAAGYASLFASLDALVFLQVPDLEAVFRWRQQQEADNVRQAGVAANTAMDAAALRRFIQHYERLTRHALQVMPTRADAVLELGPAHELWRVSL